MPKVKLKDVVCRIKDKVDKDNTELEYYIGGEHFDNGEITITNKGVIEGSTIGPAFHMKFMPGDVLLMSRNPHLRKAAVVDFEGICSDVSYVCRTKDESVLLQRFLPFVFQTDHFWKFAEENKKGSTNFFLNWSDFERYEFFLPDIDKQKELVELLWSLVDTKEAYKNLLQKTDELVKSQFIEMFANEEKTEDLDSCAYIKKGKTITRAAVVEGDIPVVAAGIEPSCYHNQSNRAAGIITISASGANAGYVNYWDVPIFASDCNTVLTKNAERLDNVFLFWRLRVMQEEIFGMKHGSGQPHVYAKDLKKIKVPIPSIDRQRQFTYMVEQSDKSKFELRQAIESIDNLIKSILYSNLEEKKE